MHRRLRLFAVAVAFLAAACAHVPGTRERDSLAPGGALRVGLYPGSPTSYVPGAEPRGVAHDVGRELASRMGVAFEPTVFPNNAKLLEAVKAGKVDLVVTNATAERRAFIDFTDAVLHIEKSFLVPAGSPIADAQAVDRPGVRVGVSEASSSQKELAEVLRHASLVPVASLQEASRMLADRRIDAFGTNNAILFEMSDGLPGSRVLPGRWGLETFAIGIPKGRAAGLEYLRAFAASAQADGTVRRAAARAGVRGTVEVR